MLVHITLKNGVNSSKIRMKGHSSRELVDEAMKEEKKED